MNSHCFKILIIKCKFSCWNLGCERRSALSIMPNCVSFWKSGYWEK